MYKGLIKEGPSGLPKVGKTSSLENMSIARGVFLQKWQGALHSQGHPSGPNPLGLPVLGLQNRIKKESRKMTFKVAVVGVKRRQELFDIAHCLHHVQCQITLAIDSQ